MRVVSCQLTVMDLLGLLIDGDGLGNCQKPFQSLSGSDNSRARGWRWGRVLTDHFGQALPFARPAAATRRLPDIGHHVQLFSATDTSGLETRRSPLAERPQREGHKDAP